MAGSPRQVRPPTPEEREWAAKVITYEFDAREKARVHAARRAVNAHMKEARRG